MPRGFNDKEKQIIKTALMEKGKSLFSTFGLKKTSIEDLTKAVGIAQGSFYNFFTSKEELYFEILENEENLIKSTLLKETTLLKGSPKEVIKGFLTYAFELIDNNVFIKQLYIENEMEILVRKLPNEKFVEHKGRDSAILLQLIRDWQNDGIIIDKQPEVIVGLIRSIFMISLHKNQIGEQVYDNSIKFLIELLAEGLTNRRANV
ncbi:TetR/AcrR family transcriptional regulator [Clostridium sp. DJ247]|uniref:TetR/AcrR family transcriptional regulator n=1 Tax=Clostridium sp. DJ247 TaxID=2726188 RepID=UPI00162AABE7|nr:TetR/AcrR family transcriptional regulator [Clostridium sp. DJ247]MBC2582259.1 TetR/AcrR family transcriptional regulator [Clostridium sp. DJ247]